MICPECGEETDCFKVYVVEETSYNAYPNEDNVDFEEDCIVEGSTEKVEVVCPICYDTLGTFSYMDEAEEYILELKYEERANKLLNELEEEKEDE